MGLELWHLETAALPGEKLNYLAIAERLAPPLYAILIAELNAGNRIFQAGEDGAARWVNLLRPFTQGYPTSDPVRKVEEPDPHYNETQYCLDDGIEQALKAPLRAMGRSG